VCSGSNKFIKRSQEDNLNYINITDLVPGEYQLQIVAVNDDGETMSDVRTTNVGEKKGLVLVIYLYSNDKWW